MSVWSIISGEVSVKKSTHFSLRECVEEVFTGYYVDDYTPVYEQIPSPDLYIWKFSVVYCCSGEYATGVVMNLTRRLKEARAQFDLESKVRWIG